MEATAHLKKIIEELFEAKKMFDIKLTEKQDEIQETDDENVLVELQDDADNLEDIISQLDEVILTIKESFDLE